MNTTQSTRTHKLTLDKSTHVGRSSSRALEGTTSVWARCSCGWWGDHFSTCPSLSAYFNDSADECETAAVEQGSEHLADQA